MKYYIPNELHVELKADIAKAMMDVEIDWRKALNEPNFETYADDGETYTDQAQEIFNRFYDEADQLLLNNGVEAG